MTAIASFASIDKKFAWSFLGFLLAVFGGGLTIYDQFIKNHDPTLAVEIISDTNVLDVKENLPELKIIYGDVDIKSLNQALSVLVFRVRNNGGAAILNTYYDDKAPVTVTLLAGKFVKVERTTATNDYLMGAAAQISVDATTLRLPQVILEPGEGYTLKALLLHGARPTIPLKASGKIAGSKGIEVTKLDQEKAAPSIWSEAFSGTLWVQLTRAPVYAIVLLVVAIALGTSLAAVWGSIKRTRRKLSLKRFKIFYGNELPTESEIVFETYVEHGLPPLVRVREVVAMEDASQELARNFKRRTLVRRRMSMQSERATDTDADAEIGSGFEEAASALMHNARFVSHDLISRLKIVVLKDDGTMAVRDEMIAFLSKFIGNYSGTPVSMAE